MSVSPDSQMMLAHILPSVHSALRRSYSSCDQMVLQDAVSTAVESFLLGASVHVRKSPAASRTWLIRAAIYAVRRELRMMTRFVDLDGSGDDLDDRRSGGSADEAAEAAILRALLERCLGASIAETIWLHEVEGCSSQDISAIQCISVVAVRARIQRSRKLLRRVFRHDQTHQNG